MKKLIMLALPLVAFASCQVEELSSPETTTLPEKETVTYYASIEDDASTRTSSTSEGKILWSEGDKMNIFMGVNNDHKDALTLTAGWGTQNGSFVGPWIAFGDGMADKLHQTVTVYPFDENNTCVPNADKTAYTVGLTIPAEQYYAEGSFANGAYPMIGVTENVKEIAFEVKNVAHVIYFKLKGENKKISKIVLSSENLALAGPAEVAVSYDSVPVATVTEATASNTVELICEGGVQLDPVNATEFHVVIAPCSGVIDVTIYDTEGGYTKRTLADQEFARGVRSPIKHTYTGENSVVDDLKNAFKNGGEYTLPIDVTVPQGTALTLETGNTLNLNLNGNTLKLAHKTTGTQASIHVGGGALHISNGTIVGEAGNYLFGTNNIKSNDSIFEMTDVNVVREKTGAAIMVIGGGTNIEFNNVNVDAKCDIFFYSYGNVDPKLNGIVIDGGRYKTAAGKKIFNAVSNKIPVIFKGNALFSDNSYLNTEWVETGDTEYPWTPKGVSQPNEETIVVTSKAGIAWVAEQVNSGADNFTGKTIYLEGDIDLTNIKRNETWAPIGTAENPFNGTFDGKGYTIKNLNIVETEAKEGKAYLGFFGYAKDATIKNVTFENVNINVACLDIDHSQGHIGAVAGSLEGTSTIENVTVKGDVKVESTVTANGASRVAVVAGGNSYGNVTMKNVHVVANDGSYLKANNNVGALAGQLQGKSVFENCSSNIDVTGTKFFAGGIIGLAAGDQTFTKCHTTGNITITAGRSGKAHDHYRVGGIAGGWADGAKNVCTLTNCSYTGALSGTNADGSVAEVFDYAGYVGRGYTLNGCKGSKVIINGVEYVQAYDTAAEAGIYTVDGVYEIATASALKIFADKVNAEDTFEGKTVRLVADLDLNNEQWTPIGYWQTFNGTFDGQGHTISNLYHHGTEEDCYVGLFGYTENATIKNLVINNVDLKLVANADWAGGHMGALVGNIDGATVIENITVTGDVKIDGDLTKKGAGRIGGVVGGNTCNATLKNVVVNANEGSFIKGNNSIGGIAGQLQGQIEFVNCSSNINVTAQQFYAGGIIGLAAAKTTFTNCTAVGNISVLAGRAGNANDLYRVGGIAGGWDDNVTSPLVLSGCSHDCTLSGKTADDKTATYFDCAGFVGRGYSAVKDAKVNVNGHEYIYQGNGVYSVDGTMIVFTAEQLQTVLDNATSDLTVCFSNDIKGNVTVNQKEGVNVLIDGNKKKFDGTIYVNGHSRYNGAETLKIQFVNFESDTVVDFISSNDSNDSVIRYAHNIVVENCSFVGTASSAVAIRTRQAYNISVKNCTATLGHSFAQLNSTAGFSAEAVTVTAGRGFNLGNSNTEATFNGCVVTATKEDGYGIRFDAGAELNVANCKVAAYEPVVFRNCTAACQFNLTSSELNAASGYHVVVASGSTPVMNGVAGLNIK